MPEAIPTVMEQIVSLCKKRAFVYPASDIYGGINGFWDYGPLGVLLKNNIRDWWWRNMVECPPIGSDGHPVEMVGIDSAIIQNPKTWVASGHVGGFSDPMVDDRETKQRYRADHVMVYVPKDGKGNAFAFLPGEQDVAEKKIKRDAHRNPTDYDTIPLTKLPLDQYGNIVAPATKTAGTLTEPRAFNLMFITYVGALQSDESKAYLRPETAQGIFLNFKNIVDTTRVRVPFGVAQIGKSFRNEVTPRNFIFRSREFEQMEMEWFCHPDEARKWYDFWKTERMKWWRSLGVSETNLRFRDHEQDELSHYSKMTVDIEYKYPFTAPDFGELEGIAHRGDYDLTQHQKNSGQKLDYFDQELQLKLKEQGKSDEEIKAASRYLPNVIEPASGLTRAVLVLLCEGYTPDETRPSKMYMKFDPKFAPVKCGIFPLVNKEGMPEIAEKIYLDLRQHFTCEFDAKQSIGKRYARMDEIGTPYCFTVDGQTLTDQTVTVRHRDTLAQERVNTDKLLGYLRERIAG
ncbi:MAG TPA: glycine--tRNA ligase [Tepidisphaeraceae bacterium]|nr:glycine--tRNA ligase [Tepidisphaeraceae bacterium]